jgi:hypothetical protein
MTLEFTVDTIKFIGQVSINAAKPVKWTTEAFHF